MRNAILGAAGAALIASGALAADLPVKAAPYVAQVAPPLPSWSSWIVSGVVGGDFNKIDISLPLAGTGSFSPSAVAFGVKSELILMLNPWFGVEHKLLLRYADPSIGLGRGVSSDAPYWRGDSFGDIVLAVSPELAFDAGVGFAAQTLKVDLAGLTNPTYGVAANVGVKVKPFGNNWVIGADLIYEDMNGFQFAGGNNHNTNIFAGASVGYAFH